MKRTIVLTLTVTGLAILLSACHDSKTPGSAGKSAPEGTPDAGAVVAVVNSEKITRQELDQAVLGQRRRLDRQYAETGDQLLRAGLEDLIAKKLVMAEAAKRGMTEENMLRAEVMARAVPPTEEEMKKFYDANANKMPGPYEAVRGGIGQHLMGLKQREAVGKFVDSLRAAAKVETSLPPLELPRVEVAAEGPARGPANAPVKVVLFSDFQCPFCKEAKGLVEKIVAVYGDKVRVVYRDYPLPMHDKAIKAAEAGHCAEEQGKFWEMHDLMFASQDKLAPEGLKSLARQIGLDGAKFDACLDGNKMSETVRGHFKAGDDAGVDSTPAFFINGRPVNGAVPFEDIRKIIDKELEQGA